MRRDSDRALMDRLLPMDRIEVPAGEVTFSAPIPAALAGLADTMAAGWQRGATVKEIDAAESAATRWRQLRRREATVPPVETTTPPYETRSA